MTIKQIGANELDSGAAQTCRMAMHSYGDTNPNDLNMRFLRIYGLTEYNLNLDRDE